jgi:hypothetical protein
LGLSSVNTSPASIQFNSNPGISWDFTPADGITSGYDFVGVATHELGHVLGFDSFVDNCDAATPGSYSSLAITPTTMDLFRFSTQSLANPSGGIIPIDLTTNTADKYFSLDRGTKIASFSTGVVFGDGRQASHWKDNLGLGIMDPTVGYGELLNVSQLDRRMFDVIGYDLNTQWAWAGPATGAWSTALNWPTACVPDGTISVTFGSGSTKTVQLLSQPASAASVLVNNGTTITLDSGTTTLTVGNGIGIGSAGSGTGTLTISGSGTVTAVLLTIGTGSVLNLGSGTLSLGSASNSGTLLQTGGTLRVSGTFTNVAGNATFGGTQNWLAGSQLTVSGGSVRFNSDAGAGGANLSMAVNTGGSITLASTQHVKNLTVSPGASAVMIGARQLLMAQDVSLVDATAELDLGSSDMVIRSPQTTTLSQIANLVKTARDSGWGGTGITSSAAKQSGITTLVPLLNDNGAGGMFLSQLDGETLLQTDIIVRYTYIGDVDLNGIVNAADFAAMKMGSINQAQLQRPVAYTDGDIDFNGIINAADFALAKNTSINQGTPLFSMAIVVPEPGALGTLILGAVSLLIGRSDARRRRQRDKSAV